MDPIPLLALSALVIGAIGAAVANLHALLERLGLKDVPPDELAAQAYKEGTARVVRVLQDRLGLVPPRPGEVDEGTARAVNEQALGQGILFMVSGLVTGADGAPAADVIVRVADADNLAGLACADVRTDARGQYVAFYDPRFYVTARPGVIRPKEVVDVVVRVLDAAGTERVRSAVFPKPDRKLSIDLTIRRSGEEPARTLRVRGTVTDAGGRLLEGVDVEVHDRDVGEVRERLGVPGRRFLTDAQGHFEIPYELADFREGDAALNGKATADLIFGLSFEGRVVAPFQIVRLPVQGDDTIGVDLPFPDDEQILGVPARDDEFIRIVAGGLPPSPGPSEFETLLRALAPLTTRRALAEFDEAGTRDVSFAAREIGKDVALIADIANAHRLAVAPFAGTPPAALYGLARMLGARDARSIAARRIDDLASGLQEAIASSTIPQLGGDLATIAANIHAVAIRETLAVRVDGGGTLNDVLASALPDASVRARLLSTAVNHTGTDAEFWTQFAADHPAVPVAPVQYALHLDTLTGRSVPLMTALREKLPAATSMRTLALHLDEARLAELIRDSGAMPSNARDGETPEAARARLAGEVTGLLESAQPTAVVARLAKDWHTATPDSVDATTVDVLTRAVLHTDFDLATGTVDALIKDHSDVLFDVGADPAARATAVAGVKRIQRLFQVSTDPTALGLVASRRGVTGLPFRGALDVARFGKTAFLARFADAPTEVQRSLSLMHDRSRAMADTVAQLVVGQHQDVRDAKPGAAGDVTRLGTEPNDPPVGPPAPADVEDIPSWSDFFGGAEVCECKECRSVIGPAAYLVDLFEFLDKRCTEGPNGVTPLDVLIGHPTKSLVVGGPAGIAGLRPDLAHIKLSCENTNTTIPTVDLINEILESVVAFGQTTPLVVDAAGDAVVPPRLSPNEPSPGVTGAELSAAPEHVVERAYHLLGLAVFPISLPYDRLMATARANMRQAGSSRAEAIRLFGAPDAETRAALVAAEKLGLLARDVEILTGAKLNGAALDAPIPTETLYGYAAGKPTWLTENSSARALLSALEISFEDLVALLRTRFVGGEVPTGDETEIGSRLFIDVEQLKALRAAAFAVAPGTNIALALDRGGLTADEVKAFVEARADRLATTIVLDPPTSCDPDAIHLLHLDASEVSADEWLAVHRFVRLAKRTGLAFADLDVALFAVAGAAARPDFSLATLGRLADLQDVAATLDVSLPVAASLVADIDTHGPSSLYDTLFIARGLARVYPAFRRGSQGEVFTAATSIGEAIPALATAFSDAPARMKDLAARLSLTNLDLSSVSRIHRTLILARALGLAPNDLIRLGKLLNDAALAGGPTVTPAALLRFVDRVRRLATTGFDAAKVAYIVGGDAERGDSAGRSADDLAKIIDAVPAVLAALIEREALERAEEADRDLSAAPFTAEDIERRKADGLSRRRAAALAHLVQAFAMDRDIMAALVDDTTVDGRKRSALLRAGAALADPAILLFSAPVVAADRPGAEGVLRAVDRVNVVITTVGLDARSFRLVTEEAALLPADFVASLAHTPDGTAAVEVLDRLACFTALSRETKRPAALSRAVKALAASPGTDWSDDAFSTAGEWLDLSVDTVKSVPRSSVVELDVAAARKAPVDALGALRERLAVARRLGLDADTVDDVIAEPIAPEALARLVAGVRSHYDASAWLDVSRQLSDPIREASRDGLVAFLLRRDGLKHADQLFSRYLIDTQTNAFVLTSRIRQAMFAVQIFVQRCLMGLESKHGVAPEQINLEEWKTIGRLPVWAALHKALLYPEELLNPAWRDDKTKIFRDFEATIRQSDVTPANAARAYGAYLDDFRVVASLEICGTFLQTVFEGSEQGLFTAVLHVVGRTRGGVPRRYFYRRLNRHVNYEEWTGWEPVNADIQGVERDRLQGRKQGSDDSHDPLFEAGVHLLPVVWRGQVHLFWPTLVRKVDEPADEPKIDAKNPVITGRFSLPYWEVKLCWTRRDGGAWTPKEQSSALVETWWGSFVDFDFTANGDIIFNLPGKTSRLYPQFPHPNLLVLKAHVQDQQEAPSLQIVLAERGGHGKPWSRFVFSFDRVASEMVATTTFGSTAGDHPTFEASDALTGSYMGLAGSGTLSVTSTEKPKGDQLFTPPGAFRLTTLNQSYAWPYEAPFFIGLSDKAYFAAATLGTTTAGVEIAKAAPTPKALPFTETAFQAIAGELSIPAIPQSAKLDSNPWVRSDARQVATATAPVIQSLPTIGPTGTKTGTTLEIDRHVAERFGASTRKAFPDTLDVSITPFFHPFAELFVTALKRDGLDALLTPAMQRLSLPAATTFAGSCKPNLKRVKVPASEGVDFDTRSPYGTHNWELFFHAPMVVALKLWDNDQLDAAIDVFHKDFDPLSAGSNPDDAWRFEGLRQARSLKLDDLLALLSKADDDPGKREVLAQVEAMRLYPFQAHRIARLRPVAYKKWATAQYVRLRLAIGDRHLRRFTPEDVNLCIQHYLIAYAVMGRRPEVVPQRVTMPARSYAELRPHLDDLGNVFFEAETKLASAALGMSTATSDTTAAGMLQRGAIGYFGIPKNEKLLALWDEVEDRLFKVRNGMNIDGIQIQLPLFPPAIDPALLAQAVAAGLAISDVLDALAAPRPPHKYRVVHRQAVELAEAVVRIGAALGATREKRDTEEMARMRATHEMDMANMIRELREQQVAEAKASRDAVSAEREAPMSRWHHYRDLLGASLTKPPGRDADDPTQINSGRVLAKRPLNLVDASTVEFEALSVIPEFAKGLALGAGGGLAGAAAVLDGGAEGITLAGGNILVEEKQEIQESFEAVRTTFEAAMLDTLASMFSLIPNFEAAVKPLGAGAAVHFGGPNLAAGVSAMSRNKHAEGAMHTFLASVYGKQAGYVLRERDWVTQMNNAAADVLSIDRKLILSHLQVASAEHQQAMQKKAVTQAEEIETHLRQKFTGLELQDFHIAQQRQLFKRFFEIALERAHQAAVCYAAEREAPKVPFVTVGRSDDPRFELMAGYELQACLADMDRSWMAGDVRGPELVRHVSLKQVNPWALHALRESGEATFSLPEVLLDMDHPGHYDRRMRSVQVTLPCVAGPHAPVTGTLTLTGSRRRKKAGLGEAGVEADTDPGQPSISLSSGREDSGLFELSMQDERFLPFEGRGVDSDWKLRLPLKVRHFNYRTISDVILTIRYTSRNGGEKFGTDVSNQIAQALGKLKTPNHADGPYQLVSVRHDFPDAWYRFQAGEGLSVSLSTDILPYALRSGLNPKLEEAHAIRLPKGAAAEAAKQMEIHQEGAAWSMTVEAAGPPPSVDDIYLLTRFKLA